MDDPPTPSIYVFGKVGYVTGFDYAMGKGGWEDLQARLGAKESIYHKSLGKLHV